MNNSKIYFCIVLLYMYVYDSYLFIVILKNIFKLPFRFLPVRFQMPCLSMDPATF